MPTLLWLVLLWLGPLVLALPGDQIKLPDVDLDWLERNASLLYPLMAVGTLALIAWGAMSSLRAVRIPVEQKIEYKRAIITLLRREIGGVAEEKIAEALRLSAQKTALLIGELEKDGVIVPATGERGRPGTVWRMHVFQNES